MKNFCKLIQVVSISYLFLFTVNPTMLAQNEWVKLNEQSTNCYSTSLEVQGSKIFLGTNNCGIFVSSDSGYTFPVIIPYSTIPYGWNSGIIRSGNTIVAGLADEEGIYRSVDEGATWQDISGATEPKGADDMLLVDNLLYTVSETGVFKIPIEGSDWVKIKEVAAPKAIAIRNNKIVVGSFPYWVSVSDDGGTTWSPEYAIEQYGSFYIHALAISGDHILAATTSGLYLSADNCQTWSRITSGLDNANEMWDLIEVGGKLYLASDYGAKLSEDNGLNWSNCGTVSLQPICFAYDSPFLFAGCPSYVYRLMVGNPAGSIEYTDVPILRVYPSPASGNLEIEFCLDSPGHITIDIVDITGRNVDQVLNLPDQIGTNEISYNTNNLENGIYFVILKAEGNMISRKVVICH